MHGQELENLKYPVGRFILPTSLDEKYLEASISRIESFPNDLEQEVHNLSNQQLDTPYRPDGWTVRQVVHHCADSHMNSLIRFKLALTEDNPQIKPYFEDRWAELADSKHLDVAPSLFILKGIHARWTVLLRSLSSADLEKSFIHPDHEKAMPLKEVIALYAWHCNHHLVHITNLKQRKNWV